MWCEPLHLIHIDAYGTRPLHVETAVVYGLYFNLVCTDAHLRIKVFSMQARGVLGTKVHHGIQKGTIHHCTTISFVAYTFAPRNVIAIAALINQISMHLTFSCVI